MSESEQRVRDFQRDREIVYGDIIAADLRELLRLLDEARAICYAWERRCDEARAKLARCEDALNGMIGLIQLVASRDDLPTGLDDLMRLSHRMTEARAYFAASEKEPRT